MDESENLQKDYLEIAKHYEECLADHGPSYRGMDWPNEVDLQTRFRIMLEMIPVGEKATILDLGCGAGLMLDYLDSKGFDCIRYEGIDISPRMIGHALHMHRGKKFSIRDILEDPLPDRMWDYIIMNGVLTEKAGLSGEQMVGFAKRILREAFNACRKGLAFNVMSTHVDWKRDDLFHWALDDMMAFLVNQCSRHAVIRMDYGLYEYTVYVRRYANA